mmetsp:Transcript_16702/g.42473  ORF Transcript_16702/g.42473 Transcript_16702/m.42473 type:complete len:200 (+) Transcript_16702:1846-2445(+)
MAPWPVLVALSVCAKQVELTLRRVRKPSDDMRECACIVSIGANGISIAWHATTASAWTTLAAVKGRISPPKTTGLGTRCLRPNRSVNSTSPEKIQSTELLLFRCSTSPAAYWTSWAAAAAKRHWAIPNFFQWGSSQSVASTLSNPPSSRCTSASIIRQALALRNHTVPAAVHLTVSQCWVSKIKATSPKQSYRCADVTS